MFKSRLIVSVTARTRREWQDKLKEIDQHGIKEVGLFLESLSSREREGLLPALVKSPVRKIPLVHIRDDTTKQEIAFLIKHFGSRYFTIHENHFHILKRWRGYYKKLYLETNTDDRLAKYVDVEEIGGFCIDLAHFKKEVTKQTKEYRYIVEEMGKVKFACNHLSGYSYRRNKDLHEVKSIRDFDYLKTLPHNIFGRVIAFEIFNPIKDQLKYQKHLKKLLKRELSFKII